MLVWPCCWNDSANMDKKIVMRVKLWSIAIMLVSEHLVPFLACFYKLSLLLTYTLISQMSRKSFNWTMFYKNGESQICIIDITSVWHFVTEIIGLLIIFYMYTICQLDFQMVLVCHVLEKSLHVCTTFSVFFCVLIR